MNNIRTLYYLSSLFFDLEMINMPCQKITKIWYSKELILFHEYYSTKKRLFEKITLKVNDNSHLIQMYLERKENQRQKPNWCCESWMMDGYGQNGWKVWSILEKKVVGIKS